MNCSDLSNWESGYVKGLKHMNEKFSRMIFISDSVGLLFGSNWTDQAVFSKELRTQQKATAYKTIDGGASWHVTLYADSGVFSDAIRIDDTIFILKNSYFGEQVNEVKSSEIFRSSNDGESWEKIYDTPKPISKLCYCNSKLGILISYYDQNLQKQIYKSNDGGINWEVLDKRFDVRDVVCSNDGLLWFLSSNEKQSNYSNLLIRRDLNSGEEKIEVLPFSGSNLSIDSKNNLWFLGNDRGKVVLYSKAESMSSDFERVSIFSSDKRLSPYYVNVFETSITVIVRESDKTLNRDEIFPIGLKYKVFRSNDSGKTWNEEKIPVDYLIEPFAFYNKDRIWMNAGGGRLQWRAEE